VTVGVTVNMGLPYRSTLVTVPLKDWSATRADVPANVQL